MLNVALTEELHSITNYGWLLESSVWAEDESNVMEYKFFDGENIISAKERTDNDKRHELDEGALISYQNDGEGYIKDVVEIEEGTGTDEWQPAAITAADEDGNIAIIKWDANRRNPVADVIEADGDTKVIYVDSNANGNEAKCVTGYTGYDFVSKPTDDGEYRNINAKYIMDGDKVAFILIDVKGDLSDEGIIENLAGLDAGEKVKVTYGDTAGQNGTLTIENINNKNAVDVTVTLPNGIVMQDKNGTPVANGGTLTVPAGSSSVDYRVAVEAGTDTGDYEVTFTYKDANGNALAVDTLTITVTPAALDDLAGFTFEGSIKTANPAANDRLSELITTLPTITSGGVVSSYQWYRNGEAIDNDSLVSNADVTGRLTLVFTLTADDNHVFSETFDTSLYYGIGTGNGTAAIAQRVDEKTVTISYGPFGA